MRSVLRGCAALLLASATAWGEGPARGVLLPPAAPRPPAPLGVYEIEVAGIGTSRLHSSIRPARAGGAGGRAALAPVGAGIEFEQVGSSSFTEGPRGAGGERYVSFTYRVRNGTGVPLTNLTLLMVSRAGTIPGTPLSTLRRFDGSPANPAIAAFVAPTGAAVMHADGSTLQALDPDVLQVYQEAEVAAIPLPGDVTGVFPWGYVVRSAADGATRTLPAAASASRFDGVLTLAFRLPLQPTAAEDMFAFFFQVLAVQDPETRLTESLEEAQDTSAVRRLRERAAALGATTVTVLAGSPAAAAEAPHYPGQRQLCSVRTAGSAAMPQNYITTPAADTPPPPLRPGETPNLRPAGLPP